MKPIGPLKSAISPAKPGPRKRYGFALHHAPRGQIEALTPKRRKRTARASAADSPIRLEFILAR